MPVPDTWGTAIEWSAKTSVKTVTFLNSFNYILNKQKLIVFRNIL